MVAIFNFIREKCSTGYFFIEHIHQEKQVVDFLTKSLAMSEFKKLRKCMGIYSSKFFSDRRIKECTTILSVPVFMFLVF